MGKGRINLWQKESEILAEFRAIDDELAQELINLRQEPSDQLRSRVESIPQSAANRKDTGRRGRVRASITWGAATALLIVALLIVFPELRAAAAQTIAEIRQTLGISVSGSENGFVTFTPGLPFNVKQPGYLPEGFVRIVSNYQALPQPERGASETLVEEVVRDGTAVPSSGAVPQRMATYRTESPHVILAYEAGVDQYVLLFERAAQPGEALPAGELRSMNGQPATLQRNGDLLMLTWIDEGTWLTLEGTLAEDGLIQIAESMVTTQTAGENQNTTAPQTDHAPAEYPLCDLEDRPLMQLLDEVSGQRYWGTLEIHMSDKNIPTRIAYGTSLEGVTPEDLFQRALAALHDPALTLQPLDYSSQTNFRLSEENFCWEPVPATPEYVDIVIDVWDEQINISFGGEGTVSKDNAELKALAINALEQELESIRQ